MWGAIKKSINSNLKTPLNELITDKKIVPSDVLLERLAQDVTIGAPSVIAKFRSKFDGIANIKGTAFLGETGSFNLKVESDQGTLSQKYTERDNEISDELVIKKDELYIISVAPVTTSADGMRLEKLEILGNVVDNAITIEEV
jgi:hypothetical protein